MKKFKVTFKVRGDKVNENVSFEVEAGNKRAAVARAMLQMAESNAYSNLYKTLENVEEV